MIQLICKTCNKNVGVINEKLAFTVDVEHYKCQKCIREAIMIE